MTGFLPYRTPAGSVGQAQVQNGYVDLSTNQTVNGTKTFSSLAISGGAIVSGTWTPTGTTVANLDSITPKLSVYTRIGNTVVFAARATVDPTASGVIQFGLSLPVASNFAAATDACGTTEGAAGFVGSVDADAANDRLAIFAGNTMTTAYDVFLVGSYRVI